jgi:hypothetical protein
VTIIISSSINITTTNTAVTTTNTVRPANSPQALLHLKQSKLERRLAEGV